MNIELIVSVMVILPLTFVLWAIGRRFDSHDKEIMELKNRINKLENKDEKDGEDD